MKRLEPRLSWEQVVDRLERVKGEKWEEFAVRHGDWGRDAALWLARRYGGLRLAELGQKAGGLDYAAVSQALRRFGKRLEKDARLRASLAKWKHEISNVET
jgi:hypothetical protein